MREYTSLGDGAGVSGGSRLSLATLPSSAANRRGAGMRRIYRSREVRGGRRPIYLDYNATTPIAPEVLEAMLPFLREHFGNPSSSHAYGAAAHEAVDRARSQVADLIGCAPDEIVFTGAGSEANNLAIKGVAFARRGQGDHLITSAVEHPAVLATCQYLVERFGYRLTVAAGRRARPGRSRRRRPGDRARHRAHHDHARQQRGRDHPADRRDRRGRASARRRLPHRRRAVGRQGRGTTWTTSAWTC